ncbi:MAG: TetR/AcrR family transcriptional regulator [Actinomycetota bacterium]|nr:TetR/AcrR family transcriptional regulator [Actinomycetota bacterium]
MTSRRERKKQQTFASIVSAADRLFQVIGYHASTIEVIAADAGVSVGTVYNYFGTKHGILLAVVTSDTEQALMDAGAALDLSTEDPVDALMPLVMTYVNAMAALGRDVIKELFRAGFDPAESAMMTELISLDERSIAQIAETLVLLRDRGFVSDDVDIASAAILIYSIVAVAILMFVSMPESTVQDLETTIRCQVTLVFEGIGSG